MAADGRGCRRAQSLIHRKFFLFLIPVLAHASNIDSLSRETLFTNHAKNNLGENGTVIMGGLNTSSETPLIGPPSAPLIASGQVSQGTNQTTALSSASGLNFFVDRMSNITAGVTVILASANTTSTHMMLSNSSMEPQDDGAEANTSPLTGPVANFSSAWQNDTAIGLTNGTVEYSDTSSEGVNATVGGGGRNQQELPIAAADDQADLDEWPRSMIPPLDGGSTTAKQPPQAADALLPLPLRPSPDVSINAARSSFGCRGQCPTRHVASAMCLSGTPGEPPPVCGLGHDSIPGLVSQPDRCLRCLSGVCGECPAGFEQVQEEGTCKGSGECRWTPCAQQGTCGRGRTEKDRNTCRVGSEFKTTNYCCDDIPKVKCCKSMPCDTAVVEEDCSGSSCEPSCDFALFTPPSKCSNPYNPDLSCGMGLGTGASLGIKEEEAAGASSVWEGAGVKSLLQGETGTCLEMNEVCGDRCPAGYSKAPCPWPGCPGPGGTCMHLGGQGEVSHCWRRAACAVANAPESCERSVGSATGLVATTFLPRKEDQQGDGNRSSVSNEEACPLTWIRDPSCTTADGSSANECGAGASFLAADGAALMGIEAETGTCVEELQICGDVCPEGYMQLPCLEAEGVDEGGGCRTCNLDGRRAITCALRRPCLPAFACGAATGDSELTEEESSDGTSDTSLSDGSVVITRDGSASVAIAAEEEAEAVVVSHDFGAGNDQVAAALAPKREGDAAVGDLVVPKFEKEAAPLPDAGSSPASLVPSDGRSAAGLLEEPRNFSALHATFLFADLTLELIEESGGRFASAVEAKLQKASGAEQVVVNSISAGSLVLDVDMLYRYGTAPSEAFVERLLETPGRLFELMDWHDTPRTVGRVEATSIEYRVRYPAPPPPEAPGSPPAPPQPIPPPAPPAPSPPPVQVKPRDAEARPGAKLGDVQPLEPELLPEDSGMNLIVQAPSLSPSPPGVPELPLIGPSSPSSSSTTSKANQQLDGGLSEEEGNKQEEELPPLIYIVVGTAVGSVLFAAGFLLLAVWLKRRGPSQPHGNLPPQGAQGATATRGDISVVTDEGGGPAPYDTTAPWPAISAASPNAGYGGNWSHAIEFAEAAEEETAAAASATAVVPAEDLEASCSPDVSRISVVAADVSDVVVDVIPDDMVDGAHLAFRQSPGINSFPVFSPSPSPPPSRSTPPTGQPPQTPLRSRGRDLIKSPEAAASSSPFAERLGGRTQRLALEQEYRARRIPYNSLHFKQQIGHSSYKSVYRGLLNVSQPVCITKITRPSDSDVSPTTILAKVQPHPNLVQLLGVAYDGEGREHLVTEFVPKGTLHSLRLDSALSARVRLDIAVQVCAAMQHLASAGVIHGNLASRNVMVEKRKPVVVKVADYATMSHPMTRSQPIPGDEETCRGSLRWISPEVWRSGAWSEKSDVWAFGVVLWELHSYTIPYGRLTTDKEVVSFLESGGRLPRPPPCPEALYNIMLKCWQEQPEDRPEFAELKDMIAAISQ